MRSLLYYALVAGSLIQLQCNSRSAVRIPYPAPLPDTVALTFLPGIVSKDSLDFNAAFSPDGRSFYFSRSPAGGYDILVSKHDGTRWQEAELAPFSEKQYSEADAIFAPDGNLYYISNRPRDAHDTIPDFDIWFVRPLPNGKWSAPENLTIVNSDSTEYYVSFAANGNLYFASSRPGGYGQEDIYVSRYVDGHYTTPVNVGPTINTDHSEHDPCISSDEQTLYFTSVNRSDGYGEGDIYYSKKTPDKKWNIAQNMGPQINTPTYEYCSYISPDGKYFFFSSNYDVKWVDLKELGVSF
jgi:Tol biopolymer transport system component